MPSTILAAKIADGPFGTFRHFVAAKCNPIPMPILNPLDIQLYACSLSGLGKIDFAAKIPVQLPAIAPAAIEPTATGIANNNLAVSLSSLVLFGVCGFVETFLLKTLLKSIFVNKLFALHFLTIFCN